MTDSRLSSYGCVPGPRWGDLKARPEIARLFPDAPEASGKARVLMSESEPRSVGDMRAAISTEIVRLQAEYYGRGPTRAKTYIVEDLVVVVLEETLTRAEQTLVERGEHEAIEQIRRRFQQHMGASFTEVVERATGRQVRVFLSEADVQQDVSIEIFLLAGDGPDVEA